MAKAVKLADIAQKCNVSTVTVSKALSGQKGVSEEMREKIVSIAEELGYKTPSAIKQLKDKQSYNIGVLVEEKFLDKYDSFYWQMYQAVATKAVSKECFTMLELISSEQEKNLVLPKLIQENKVDGFIIIGMLSSQYLAMLEKNTSLPYIYMDFYNREYNCDSVITDNYYGMFRLTNHLIDNGHKEIGYVGRLLATDSITDRYFGYSKAMFENHLEIKPEWIIEDRDEEGELYRQGFTLPKNLPTAFACNSDMSAGVLINTLEKQGIRVPEDVSVVGFDNYIFPGTCDVEITTYEVDIKEMARKSVNNLLKKISGESYKKGISIVEGKIIYKNSVKTKK